MTFPRTESVPIESDVPTVEPAGDGLVAQLAGLVELHRIGGLTDDEFSAAKALVLHPPANRLAVPRMVLHMPSRRIVPEVHPVGAARSVTLTLLDQAARRLGGTCRPLTESDADTSPEESHLATDAVTHVIVADVPSPDGER